MYETRSRHAYGVYIGDFIDNRGKVYYLGDMVSEAAAAGMDTREYEKELANANPQLYIIICMAAH